MPLKFTYFNVNGLGEPIRYIILYTGRKFEDVQLDFRKWPIEEIKNKLPFGQLPLLEDDGKVLNQSIAIARYVSANTDLLPTDPWQQAVLDATVLTIYDFHEHVFNFIHEKEPENKEVLRKKLMEEVLDFYFSRFEKQMKENNGHLGIGGKLNWADFMLIGIIECANLFLEDSIEKNYPLISALVEEIQQLPGVKEYIRDRKPYDITNT